MKIFASSLRRLTSSGASFCLCAALAAGILATTAPTHAVLIPGASVQGSYRTNTTETGYVQGDNGNTGTVPIVGILSYSHENSAHELSGTAAMGSVKFFNEVATTNGTSRGAIAGGFQEMITISDPARTGHQGVFTGSLRIHMDQTVTGGASFYNLFGVSVAENMELARAWSTGNYGMGGYALQAYNWSANSEAAIDLDHELTFSIGFTFGTAFDVGVWMRSFIEVGYTPGTVQHNALNTLAWNGISSVQDTTTGTTVAPEEYTATGSQGGNFAAPIPEPSTALLALAGSAAFLLRRRRAN